MVTTDSKELAQKIRALAGHGISSTALSREKSGLPWFRSASYPGYNFRMSNILAAVGVEQLKKIEEMNQRRREHAAYLNEKLRSIEEIDLPVEKQWCTHVYQMYTIKVKLLNRDTFVKKLRERGIGASVHFDPPVHLQHFYRGKYNDGDLEVTDKVARSMVTLPMFPHLKKSQLRQIVLGVKEVIREVR
jgi:dTDP-4-amino-4,6-dideoxygalactose transaminase